jgi:hypothetical protein
MNLSEIKQQASQLNHAERLERQLNYIQRSSPIRNLETYQQQPFAQGDV